MLSLIRGTSVHNIIPAKIIIPTVLRLIIIVVVIIIIISAIVIVV